MGVTKWKLWTMGVALAWAASACGKDSGDRLALDPGDGADGGIAPPGQPGGGGASGRVSQTPLPLPASQLAPGSWCESDGWCWYNPLPNGNFMIAAAGAGQTDLWFGGASSSATGGTTNLLHFSGGRWNIAPSPLGATEAIWAASANDVWFAGTLPPTTGAGTGALAHWDGTSMAVSTGFSANIMFGVWGSGPNDVYATGIDYVRDVSIAAHWDGHAWSPIPELTAPNISGAPIVSGSGPNDVWIGGSQSSFHFDGRSWTRVPQLEGVVVQGLTVAAPGDVWLIARNPDGTIAVEHLDASGLTVSLPQSSAGGVFNAIAAVSSRDIWLVGSFFDSNANDIAGFVSHFDGQTWQRAPTVPTALNHVTSTPLGVFAVGNSGEIVRLVSTPALAFTELRSGTDQTLSGVFGNAPTDMWAVGDAGTILHYDGHATTAVPAGTTANLSDVWGAGPNDIWAVGQAGTVVHYDGHSFTRVTVPTTVDLKAVFTARANDVWIGGDQATLLHGNGTTFSLVSVPGIDPSSSIRDLHGIAADDLWLAGGALVPAEHEGYVAHYDGHAWSPVDVLTFPGFFSQTIERVWQVAPNDVWATVGQLVLRGGGPKGFWHFDGTSWTSLLVDQTQPTAPVPYVFPNDNHASFVFGPHDRWRVDFGGLFQRSTE